MEQNRAVMAQRDDLPGSDLDEPTLAVAIPSLILATLAFAADGYDLGVIGLVVPELIKTWHITPPDIVPTVSAGVFGLLIGAPLFGYLGSRIGRKDAMLICLAIIGSFSLINMFAANLTHFIILRFLTGIGLGGIAPVIVSLAAEIAPKRLRGLFIVIVLFGVPAGLVLPGWTAALLVPHYGWPALFLVGGALPLVIGVLSFFILRRPRNAPASRAAAIAVSGERPARLRELFAGKFAIITPMFWILFTANQFTNFFVLTWLPTLLQKAGLSTGQAGINTSYYSMGGLVGGAILLLVIDRFGGIPVLVLFLIGVPAVAAIGSVDPTSVLLIGAVALSGFSVTGNNFATNAVLGMLYPLRLRSVGAGLAQMFGRIGALGAQYVGGYLFVHQLSMQEMYFTPGAVLLIGAAATFVLVLISHREFGAGRLSRRPELTIDASPMA